MLRPGRMSQGIEARGGIFPEHQKSFDTGPWGNCLKIQFKSEWPGSCEGMMEEDCLC